MKTSSCSAGERPADGSSSSSTDGLHHQRPAHRHHLALAAGQRAGALLAALAERGEQLGDEVEALGERLGRRGRAPSRRFSSMVRPGKTLLVCGTKPTPVPRPAAWAFRPVMSSPRSVTVPARIGDQAEQRLEQRRLAGAVRADDADELALAERSRSQPLRMLTPGHVAGDEVVAPQQGALGLRPGGSRAVGGLRLRGSSASAAALLSGVGRRPSSPAAHVAVLAGVGSRLGGSVCSLLLGLGRAGRRGGRRGRRR